MKNTIADLSSFTIVHHVDESKILTSRGRVVVQHSMNGTRKITMPFERPRDFSFGIRMLERLLRADKCLVVPHDGSVVIIRGGKVYRWGSGLEIVGRLQGDCPLHRSSAEGASGSLYFGEYFMNPSRVPVRIHCLRPSGTTTEIAYEFPAGQIRHVHGIHRDPFHATRLWVTVGDENGECYLYWSDDEFDTIHRIGDGSQLWRAVGLMFSDDAVLWGTDSPHRTNHFVAMDRASGELRVGQKVEGTIWYAGRTCDGVYFAGSSVEKGPGVTTNRANVYVSWNGVQWECKAGFDKDCLPMPAFKWGTISFPSGSFSSEQIWISGEALRGLDGRSQLLNL
jgi:hypothetical protein